MLKAQLARYPAPPATSKDVFQLCRGFERAFSQTVESTDYSGFIRREFSDDGLAGKIRMLPLEKHFRLDNVKSTVREADGYQAHLVSPEFGLKRLVADALALLQEPVNVCVRRIHQLLLDAARDASKKASLLADTVVIDEKKVALKLPAFESAVMVAATRALEKWRDEAMEVASSIVEMERSYVTAAFFRHRTSERYQRMADKDLVQQLESHDATGVDTDSEDESRVSSDGSPATIPRQNSNVPSAGLSGGLAIPTGQDDPDDLKTGYLEKRISDTSSRQNLPEAMRWQKRYFVLTELKGMLYYFKSADDPPNYKGVINMRECKVEDVDADGMPTRSAARSKFELDGSGQTASLLIKITNKDPNKPVLKNHGSIILRAPSGSEKFSWLARLKHASEMAGPRGPVRSYVTTPQGVERSSLDSTRPSTKTPTAGPTTGFGAAMLFSEGSSISSAPFFHSEPGVDNARVFDEYLKQLAEDTLAYVRTVCGTVVLTVPKAIVHCQIKRAQAHLLESLYAAMSELRGEQLESLLVEDSELAQARAKIAGELKELEFAVKEAKEIQETSTEGDKSGDDLYVPIDLIKLAGLRRPARGPSAHPIDLAGGRAEVPNGAPWRPPTATTSPELSSPSMTVPRRRPPPAPPGTK
eukprot:jgi/Botrbrau1/22206/Bobra.168_1s0037.1